MVFAHRASPVCRLPSAAAHCATDKTPTPVFCVFCSCSWPLFFFPCSAFYNHAALGSFFASCSSTLVLVLTDRAFLYTCNRHFPLKYLHQVGRSLASANLLVSPAYGQELYVGVDDGADSGSADTGVPADRCRRGSGIQRRRGGRHWGRYRAHAAGLRRHLVNRQDRNLRASRGADDRRS